MKSVHVRIEGRVQGVGCRAWAETAAQGLRLTGWIRNRRDGSVEAVFQGEDDRVDEMLLACERGPPAAAVSKVEIVGDDAGSYSAFEFRGTV